MQVTLAPLGLCDTSLEALSNNEVTTCTCVTEHRQFSKIISPFDPSTLRRSGAIDRVGHSSAAKSNVSC